MLTLSEDDIATDFKEGMVGEVEEGSVEISEVEISNELDKAVLEVARHNTTQVMEEEVGPLQEEQAERLLLGASIFQVVKPNPMECVVFSKNLA